MDEFEKIQILEGEIIELKFKLKDCQDKELIYQEILTEINNSLIELIKRDVENKRFRFDESIDFRDYVINLKKDLDEYKRIYKKISF